MKRYARDDRRPFGSEPSPQAPLPRARLDEVTCVLEVLGSLTLDPRVAQVIAADSPAVSSPKQKREEREREDWISEGGTPTAAV